MFWAVIAGCQSYGFTGPVSIDKCGQTLVPGDFIFVQWSLNGDPEQDTFFVAVRPVNDLFDDTAESPTHPQCAGASANIVILQQPHNTSFPFNRSEFLVRINTDTGNGIHSDSCIFKSESDVRIFSLIT